jgi:hypothetical protein
MSGSSFAAALVAGTFALLRSLKPDRPVGAVWNAILDPERRPRRSLVPPSVDGDASLALLETM